MFAVPGIIIDDICLDGDYFVVIELSIPFCLHLPNGGYKVRTWWEGNSFLTQIQLEQRKRSAQYREGVPYNIEDGMYPNELDLFSFSHAKIILPVISDDPTVFENISRVESFVDIKREDFLDQAISAINTLTAIYKHCTGECQLRLLSGSELTRSHNLWFIPKRKPDHSTFLPVYSLIDNRNYAPVLSNAVVEEIRSKSFSGSTPSLHDELLQNAQDFLYRGNHRLAVIEAETAFEAAILSMLREYYKNSPADFQKLESIKMFTNALNSKLFTKAIKPRSFGEKEDRRIYWRSNVWDVRNGLVHGRTDKCNFDTAARAIWVVEETLEYLIDREIEKNKPWRFSR